MTPIRENKSTTEQNTASIIPPTHPCHPRYPRFGFRFIVGCADYGVARKPWNVPLASM
jgi:hypothetical protein